MMLVLSGCDDQPADTSTASAPDQRTAAAAAATPPAPSDQTELKTKFDAAPGLLAEARTQAVFSQFRPTQQAQLTSEAGTLKVTATGTDPQMVLPAFIQGKKFIVEATVTSPAATLMQIFYLRKGQTTYTDAQSQTAQLLPGRNVVYLQFDAPDMIDPLRLDVGAVPGDYVIESMVARVIP